MRLAGVMLVRMVWAVVLAGVVGRVAESWAGAVVLAIVAVGLGAWGVWVPVFRMGRRDGESEHQRRCQKVLQKE